MFACTHLARRRKKTGATCLCREPPGAHAPLGADWAGSVTALWHSYSFPAGAHAPLGADLAHQINRLRRPRATRQATARRLCLSLASLCRRGAPPPAAGGASGAAPAHTRPAPGRSHSRAHKAGAAPAHGRPRRHLPVRLRPFAARAVCACVRAGVCLPPRWSRYPAHAAAPAADI